MTHHTYEMRGPGPTDPMLRTFRRSRVLAGFLDRLKFSNFAMPHIAHVDPTERLELERRASECQRARERLPDVDVSDVVFRAVEDPQIDLIRAQPVFQANFRPGKYQFAWISPAHVIPIQVWTALESHSLATDPAELVRSFLPANTPTPLELSLASQQGPVMVTSSAPYATSFSVGVGGDGVVSVSPSAHVNLVQIAHYNRRFYVRNGTHRLAQAAVANLLEVPALVVEADSAEDAMLNLGPNGFTPEVLLSARPPLISDFTSECALQMLTRAQRYGYCVTVTPLIFPI